MSVSKPHFAGFIVIFSCYILANVDFVVLHFEV